MQLPNKKLQIFFVSFVLSLFIFSVGYITLVKFIGIKCCTERWLTNIFRAKEHIAASNASPRIIIMGGSASLFGINSKLIEKETGIKTINYAMHAAIPFRFYYSDIKRILKKNDILVLPLEICHHYQENSNKIFTDFAVSMLLGVNQKYQSTLTAGELYSLYCEYGCSWLNNVLIKRTARSPRKKWSTTLKKWEQGLKKTTLPTIPYNISSLNEHGDMLISSNCVFRPYNTNQAHVPTYLTKEFLKEFKKIRDLATKRKCKLILTWSPLYWYANYTNLKPFIQLLEKNGIKISGRPEAFAFPHYCFYDTVFHLNKIGSLYNSMELAKIICKEINKRSPLQSTWQHKVFAESPRSYFPDVKKLSSYQFGVKVADQQFSMNIELPPHMLRKNIGLNLMVKCFDKTTQPFKSIKVKNFDLKKSVLHHSNCLEYELYIPSVANTEPRLKIDFIQSKNGSLGFERGHVMEEKHCSFQPQIFFARDTSKFKLISGFSATESWGVWSIGKKSILQLNIDKNCIGKELTLYFSILPPLSKEFPQISAVASCKGQTVKQFTMNFQNAGKQVAIKIPAKLNTTDKLLLTFEPNRNRIAPNDSRPLGLGFKSVSITAD